jgi:glycosyltransferase involved in cell wall biosynthesis
MKKTIDVIIPVYNGLPYVLITLRSVINQTLKPDRILVVNDGSNDKTVEEIEKIQKAEPEANILIINKKNGGHSSATNEGIRHSSADFIGLVDADDVWLPTKLEKQMRIFETSDISNLGVVYTDYASIDQNNRIINIPGFQLDKTARGSIFKRLLIDGNLIAGSNSAVLVKKECFQKTGFFDEFLRCGEDWDMWIRISQNYSYDYVPEVLVHIRRHPQNLSNVPMIHLKSNLYILQKWVEKLHELGGYTLIADHLSVSTMPNLKELFFKAEHENLRVFVKKLSKGLPFPRIMIIWGITRKLRKKIFKLLLSKS